MTGATAAWSLSRSPDRDSVRAGVAGASSERGDGAAGGGELHTPLPRARGGGGSAEAADLDTALRRARDGDERGFRELWAALQPRLLRYLAVKAPGVAEDVAAETWLQVVRDLARFRGDADDFRAWLFTVARNRAVDAARASSARPVLLLPDPPEPATTAGSAEAQALERLSTQDALRLVATLPADQAELVALRVIAGLDVAAVASLTGRSARAGRFGVHRALKSLSMPITAAGVASSQVPSSQVPSSQVLSSQVPSSQVEVP